VQILLGNAKSIKLTISQPYESLQEMAGKFRIGSQVPTKDKFEILSVWKVQPVKRESLKSICF
jgi:hypothetical protein